MGGSVDDVGAGVVAFRLFVCDVDDDDDDDDDGFGMMRGSGVVV
mgnify:CR=1 FL=1